MANDSYEQEVLILELCHRRALAGGRCQPTTISLLSLFGIHITLRPPCYYTQMDIMTDTRQKNNSGLEEKTNNKVNNAYL